MRSAYTQIPLEPAQKARYAKSIGAPRPRAPIRIGPRVGVTGVGMGIRPSSGKTGSGKSASIQNTPAGPTWLAMCGVRTKVTIATTATANPITENTLCGLGVAHTAAVAAAIAAPSPNPVSARAPAAQCGARSSAQATFATTIALAAAAKMG